MSSDLHARASSTTAPDATVAQAYGRTLSRRDKLKYILVLGALVALGPFTVDLYLPAFPDVAADLSVSDAAIQLTLTATMVGFALGQLIVGPLSDALGRRKPLLIATAVHIGASIAVVFAPTVELVMAGRVLQGIGAAGAGVVAMAMVRDLFGGQQLIRMLARMALVTGLAPVVAPVIGSQLLSVMEWRGIFAVLAAYGLVMIVVAAFLMVETMPASRRGRFEVSTVARRYRHLFRDTAFVGIAVVGAMSFTALFAYLSASSFILQDLFGLSPQQYGLVFGINSVGLVIGNQVSARLMRVLPPRAVTTAGLSIQAGGALALLTCGLLDTGVVPVLISLFFVVAPVGLIMPTVQVTALAGHAGEAGTAASLIGALNMGVAGLATPLIGAGGMSVTSMAVVMIGSLAIANASLWLVVRRRASNEVVA
ncbi:multidrug effflux MFS transporter [Demequina sp. NBRC 110056]|uniref:multidrug effflux MFS transporter n=1 Tax=Demequina sp. NBRC 110056 TaxID=1570345 RepID=UPI00352AA629